MNDTELITQLTKLKIGNSCSLVDTAIKRIEQAHELITTISENGFMNDTNDTEAEVAEIVWQCREFLTPK